MATCSPNPNNAPDPLQMEKIVPKTEPEPEPDPSASFGPVVKRDPVITLISPVTGLEPLTWSQDHRLAASTTTSVSLMELVCDVHSNNQDVILHRTSVPVPDKLHELKVGPAEQLAKARQTFSSHPDPAVSQLFMADRVLNPFVGVHKGIKYTSWSPLGCDVSGRCLLACLTLDHRLTIHSSHKRLQWSTLADLTDLYGESLENRGYSLQPGEPPKANLMDLDELQRRFLMQTPVRMEWSSMCTVQHVQGDNKCKEIDTVLLAVLMENGDLVVWQFRLPFLGRDSVLSCNTIQSGVAHPSVLAWWEYEHSGRKMSGLIVGSEVGPVKIMPVNLKAVKGYFTLRQPVVLWQEPDQIPVQNIKCVTLYHPVHMCNCSLVVAARGTYLFWCLLVISKAGLNVHNSHVTGLHSLPIVSMAASRQLVSIFTCSMDGGVKKLTPIFTEKAIAFKQEVIVLPENLQGRRMHGIAVSPSGAYMALVSMEGISNGHHPIDRTYQVHFVTLKTPENAAAMLLKSPLQNLYKQADLLDLVRWKVLKDKCIPTSLQKNLDQMVHNTGSTYLWRFKLFLVRMLYQSLQKARADPRFKPSREHSKVSRGDDEDAGEDDDDGGGGGKEGGEQGKEGEREKEGTVEVKVEDTEEQMGEVQAWIGAVESHLIREHMKKVLGEVYLHTWITENTSIPTRGVCDYLSSDPADDRNAEVLIGHVTKKMNKQTFPEYCSLCKEVLPFTDHKNATCVNGHMWLRCVLSYQACQTLTFRRCLLQDSIARLPVPEDPEWIKKILQGPCTFCDSPII